MYTIVDKVIYFYIFICLFLLIYNIVYIIRRTHQKKRRARQIERWKAILTRRRMPVKKLRNPEALTAWHSALFAPDSPLSGGERAAYLDENRQALLHLAWDYRPMTPWNGHFAPIFSGKSFLQTPETGGPSPGPFYRIWIIPPSTAEKMYCRPLCSRAP